MIRTGALALTAAAAALFLGATPAFSGDTGGIAVTASKHQDGPFTNNSPSYNMEPVETKTAWFKVKNRTNDKLKGIRLFTNAKVNPDEFSLRFFHHDENITADTFADDYRFDLDAGGTTKIKALIKNKAEGAMCFLVNARKAGIGEDTAYATANTTC